MSFQDQSGNVVLPRLDEGGRVQVAAPQQSGANDVQLLILRELRRLNLGLQLLLGTEFPDPGEGNGPEY
jgi:hypothetical protein